MKRTLNTYAYSLGKLCRSIATLTFCVLFLLFLPVVASSTNYSWTLESGDLFGHFYAWDNFNEEAWYEETGGDTGSGHYDSDTEQFTFELPLNLRVRDILFETKQLNFSEQQFLFTEAVLSGSFFVSSFDPFTGELESVGAPNNGQFAFTNGETVPVLFRGGLQSLPLDMSLRIGSSFFAAEYMAWNTWGLSDGQVGAQAIYNGITAHTPEPMSLALLSFGALMAGGVKRKLA